jgi:TonB family protein
VSRDLFRPVLEGRRSSPASRLSALPLSMAVHAVVLAVLIGIPLLAPDVLPLVQGSEIAWTPVVLPPAPPPIPAPAPRRIDPAATVEAPSTPLEPPKGVSPERLLAPDTPPDVALADTVGSVPGTGVPGGTGMVPVEAPPPTRPATPVPVSQLLKPPVKIRDVSPVYPELAIRGRVEGQVVIEAVIGLTGDVQETRILKGKLLLTEAALAAVRQWKYTPTLLNGRPVPVVMTVTVTFTLQ